MTFGKAADECRVSITALSELQCCAIGGAHRFTFAVRHFAYRNQNIVPDPECCSLVATDAERQDRPGHQSLRLCISTIVLTVKTIVLPLIRAGTNAELALESSGEIRKVIEATRIGHFLGQCA